MNEIQPIIPQQTIQQPIVPIPVQPSILEDPPKPKSKILLISIIFLVSLIIISLGYWVYQNYFISQKTINNNTVDSITPQSTSPTNIPDVSVIDTEKVKATSTPKLVVTKTPTPKPLTTATPIVKYSICSISVIADASSVNNARLIAGASTSNSSYIKGAQWDFDGNGTWDTDMNLSNQNIVHSYSNGSYNVKLKTLMSDGSTTDICNKSVSMPFGFSVSLTGIVYEDINCNDMREPSEKALNNVTVAITNMDGFATLATLTTNSSGYYNFNYILSGNNSITVQPHDTPLDNYGVTKTRHQITLNSTQSSSNMDLGQIPSPVYEYCQ